MQTLSKIAPCLWFDSEAEEAANYYVGIFPRSRITTISRYGEAGHETHGMPAGSVLTVAFELDGQSFTALNGGPAFKFNEAISFQVNCETQDEIDYYWDRLGAGGDEAARQCGWLKDRFGVSWQIVPGMMSELMNSSEPGRSERVMTALLKMKKLDLNELIRAAAG